jgi:hypothetical protein
MKNLQDPRLSVPGITVITGITRKGPTFREGRIHDPLLHSERSRLAPRSHESQELHLPPGPVISFKHAPPAPVLPPNKPSMYERRQGTRRIQGRACHWQKSPEKHPLNLFSGSGSISVLEIFGVARSL